MISILVTLLILLVIVALAAAILQYIPLDPPFRNVIMLVIGVLLLLWLIMALSGQMPVVPLRR